MYKERVVASKTCQKKWDENAKKIHAEKLKHIKPSIDNSAPQTQVHLENRRKRDQLVEDRLTTIEKHNLILLDRMMTIMKRPSSLSNNNTRSKSPSKSLNREAKKRELEKINAENQLILKKLTNAKAYYDHKDWDNFQKNQEMYLKNICEYPVQKSQATTQTLPKINSREGTSSTREKSLSSPDYHSAPTTSSEKKKKSRFTKKTIEAHKEWSSSTEKKHFSDNDNDSLMLSDMDDDDDDDDDVKETKVETNTQAKKKANATSSKGKDKAAGKGGKGKDKVATNDDKSDGGDSGSESLGSDFSDSFDESDDESKSKDNANAKDDDKDKDKEDALSNSNSFAASEGKNSTILSPASRHQEEFEKDDEEYKPQEEEEEERASEKNKEEEEEKEEEKEDSDLDGLDNFEDDLGDKSDPEQ